MLTIYIYIYIYIKKASDEGESEDKNSSDIKQLGKKQLKGITYLAKCKNIAFQSVFVLC